MTFIALMDLYYRYQTEVSAVFGVSPTHSQLFAHLLVIQEKLPKDIRRTKPEELLKSLKQLSDSELQILLGAGKGQAWLQQFEEKIDAKRAELRQLKLQQDLKQIQETPTTKIHRSNKRSYVLNREEAKSSQTDNNSWGIVRCIGAVLNCFLCCRRKPHTDEDPLLSRGSVSSSYSQGS